MCPNVSAHALIKYGGQIVHRALPFARETVRKQMVAKGVASLKEAIIRSVE